MYGAGQAAQGSRRLQHGRIPRFEGSLPHDEAYTRRHHDVLNLTKGAGSSLELAERGRCAGRRGKPGRVGEDSECRYHGQAASAAARARAVDELCAHDVGSPAVGAGDHLRVEDDAASGVRTALVEQSPSVHLEAAMTTRTQQRRGRILWAWGGQRCVDGGDVDGRGSVVPGVARELRVLPLVRIGGREPEVIVVVIAARARRDSVSRGTRRGGRNGGRRGRSHRLAGAVWRSRARGGGRDRRVLVLRVGALRVIQLLYEEGDRAIQGLGLDLGRDCSHVVTLRALDAHHELACWSAVRHLDHPSTHGDAPMRLEHGASQAILEVPLEDPEVSATDHQAERDFANGPVTSQKPTRNHRVARTSKEPRVTGGCCGSRGWNHMA